MDFITLTHNVGDKPKTIYVNVDQICWVGDAIDAAPGYQTLITLANGAVAVSESVTAVMQMIKQFDEAKIVA
jgi:uncharacterized protein YlzI (FlbEa/FlbD family)